MEEEDMEYVLPTPEAARAAVLVLAAQLNQIPGGHAEVKTAGAGGVGADGASGAESARLRVRLVGSDGYRASARSAAERLAKWMGTLAAV